MFNGALALSCAVIANVSVISQMAPGEEKTLASPIAMTVNGVLFDATLTLKRHTDTTHQPAQDVVAVPGLAALVQAAAPGAPTDTASTANVAAALA